MAEMAEETAGELPCKTRTVVVEVKYFSTQNVVIHTENCSASDSDSDSEEEVDIALETTLGMIRPTRLGRIRTLTRRMTDFLQAGMTGM